MTLGTGILLIGFHPLSITRYSLALGTGAFTITTFPATITVQGVFNLDTGIFKIDGGNLGIYGTAQQPTFIDLLAEHAPYPPADFFIPVTDTEPTVVLSPEAVYGNSSLTPNGLYIDYYDSVTQLWNDAGYQLQYPGQSIPAGLKQDVSDQTFQYNQYLVDHARWQSAYDMQKVFQWPYYWALNVARAPIS